MPQRALRILGAWRAMVVAMSKLFPPCVGCMM